MFGFLGELPAFALTSGDVGNLRLAGHRVVRTSLRTLGNGAPDTAFMAVQLVVAGPGGPTRQIVVIATPPDAMTVAYLVNVVSVQLAARVNNVAVFTEVIGTVVVAVILFALWGTDAKPSGHGISFLFSGGPPAGHESARPVSFETPL